MGQTIETVRSALETLRSARLPSGSAEELSEEVVELRALIDGMEVEWTRRVGWLAESGVPMGLSATQFLKYRCKMTGRRALRAVVLANRLSDLPLADKRFKDGDLSLDQLRVFADQPMRVSEALAADEAYLVEAVAPLSVEQTRKAVDYWRWAVDGPAETTDHQQLFEERYAYASRTWRGMVRGEFLLDPLAGETLLEALAAATPPAGVDDRRTARQRRADALADMARGFLDSGQAPGKEKPHVMILTDLDALQGSGGGLHETVTGQVLSPETIRQLCCDSTISRVVFGPNGEPIDVGRATRIIPPAIRRAVVARDRHCSHPGCDRHPRWCDVHHIIHWADGGPTTVSNCRLLCRVHHTREHHKARNRGP